MPTYLLKKEGRINRELGSGHPAKVCTPTGPIELGVVFDRSESMKPLRSSAVNGFNALLEEQRKLKFPVRFSLSFFNDEIQKIHDGAPIAEIPIMELADYVPSGNTALHDGIGSMIESIGDRVDQLPHNARVLIAILTDGCENASTRYSKSDIFDLIAYRRNACNWQFLFLGVGGNTIQTGLSLGIQRANILRFDAEPGALSKIMKTLSNTFRAYQLGDKNFALLLRG
jgi:hypothetical protein